LYNIIELKSIGQVDSITGTIDAAGNPSGFQGLEHNLDVADLQEKFKQWKTESGDQTKFIWGGSTWEVVRIVLSSEKLGGRLLLEY
jgi:hypothetical protein